MPSKPKRILLLIWLCLPWPAIVAQYPTSTLSGSIADTDGRPVADISIQWSQNGQLVTLHSDAKGEFLFHFAIPGRHVLKFEHPAATRAGNVEVMIHPDMALHLKVIYHAGIGDRAGAESWEIVTRRSDAESAWQPEMVLTSNQVESLPGTEHLWSILNDVEVSAVDDRFDISGLHSHRQQLLGVRGSSWSQNQFSINGLSVTHPSGDGMLQFPDMTATETTIYSIGDSGTQHAGPGAHLTLIPKAGDREPHGQAQLFFQGGALQNTNPSERYRFFRITESDERWRHFVNGGFQLGGPLGSRPWNYFGAVSVRNLEKRIRNHPQPMSASLLQGAFHLTGQTSPRDMFRFFGSMQREDEPQAESSPQAASESSLDRNTRYYAGQGSWTRNISSSSIVDLRIGISSAGSHSRFQDEATGQSCEDLYPGYSVAGLPDSPSPWDMMAMLNNTRRGPAPLAISWDAASTSGVASIAAVRGGFWHSRHRITADAKYLRQTLEQRNTSVDGVNLLFFEGAPNSVRLLNTPAQTRERISQMELHASDSLALARLTLTFGVASQSSWGKNILSSGQSANTLQWNNVAGRIGLAYPVLNRGPIVLRVGAAQIFHQPLASTWTAVNPEGLGVRLFSWIDVNGDHLFQAGENGRMLKVYGSPYAHLDPRLENPRTTEFTAGFAAGGSGKMAFQFYGFHRSEHSLISLVNEGVPFSSYSPVLVSDPGPDGEVGTADDRFIYAFNQKVETLGHDRYALTNPGGFSAYSQGMELQLNLSFTRFQAEVTMARFRAVASTAPGILPRENDTEAYLGIFDDPNKAILAKGSTYFDRGTMGRLWAAAKLPWKMRGSLILAYQDGMPYASYLPVKGLNQGIIAILTTQRGPGARGSVGGPRTTYNTTLNVRISRDFSLERGSMTALLDVFNLTNQANALMETSVAAPTQYWRIPLRFQTPRSLQLGIRYRW